MRTHLGESRRGIFRLTGIIGAFVIALLSMPAGASVRPVYGGEARIGGEGAVSSRDPRLARTSTERLLAEATQCTLADLTASVESVEDNLVLLRLLPNLVFHDGTRIRAGDVAASLNRIKRMDPSPPAAWRLLVIATTSNGSDEEKLDVSVSGETTLEIRLVSPELDLLAWLDDPRLPMVRADGSSACGPFRPASSESTSPEIRLVPFERHPRGRPFLDAVTIVPFQPPSAQRMELSEVDLAAGHWALPEPSATTPDHRLVSVKLSVRLASDRALRRRISSAMDRDALVRFLLGRGARPIISLAELAGQEPPGPDERAGEPKRELSRVGIGYEASCSLGRLLAERVQLRLHDQGIRSVLVPLSDAREFVSEGADLVVDLQDDLPGCPLMRLVDIAYRHGGDPIARWAIAALMAEPDERGRRSLAAALEEAVGLIPLALSDMRVWRGDDLHPAAGAGALLDPAELWRWPDDLPREDQASSGTLR